MNVSNLNFYPEMSVCFLKNNIFEFKLDILYSDNWYIDLEGLKKTDVCFLMHVIVLKLSVLYFFQF